MANTLSKSGIANNTTIEAWQVTQSVDAFTGIAAYDITISGSLTVIGPVSASSFTGSLLGTSSYALSASYFSGSISNAISASYALTASYVTTTPTKINGEYIAKGTTTGVLGDLKVAAGYGAIPQGNTSIDLTFNTLISNTLGLDCFVSVGISSSYTTSSMQYFPRIDSLTAGVMRFSVQTANASSDIPFFYTIIYR